MSTLKTCPQCGQPTLNYNGRLMHCNHCDFTFYNNTAAAVAVVIRYRDEVLLTIRNQPPALGKLDLAGGFVDFEETAEQACARELYEEMKINLEVSKLKYLCSLPNIYTYKNIDYHTLDLFYEYEVEEKFDVSLAKDEIKDVKWFKIQAIREELLAFDSQKRFFKKYTF